MSDYRRFVSYIYAYKNEKKEKNTGFAKVEARNGNLKISIQLENVPEGQGRLDAYGFVRKGEKLYGIPLGELPASSRPFLRITTFAENVAGSGYSLGRLSGLWLKGNQGENYITIWDDEPVTRMDLEIEVETEGKEEAELDLKADSDLESEAENEAVRQPETGVKEYRAEAVDREEVANKESSVEIVEGKVVQGASSQEIEEIQLVSERNMEASEKKETDTEETAKRNSASENMTAEETQPAGTKPEASEAAPESRELASGSVPESCGTVPESRETVSTPPEGEIKTEKFPAEKNINGVRALEAAALSPSGQASCPKESGRNSNCPQCLRQSSCPRAANEHSDENEKIWNRLSHISAHCQPLKEGEAMDCIRITPRELHLFQNRNWNPSRNNFILHGYYNFHHLLFGKFSDGSYFLGVPGYYTNQEQKTAISFGFPIFKEGNDAKNTGRLGYWCRPLS